jgi:hypothetical protein
MLVVFQFDCKLLSSAKDLARSVQLFPDNVLSVFLDLLSPAIAPLHFDKIIFFSFSYAMCMQISTGLFLYRTGDAL